MVYFARWRIVLIIVVSSFGVLYALPNFVSFSYFGGSILPHRSINLGLDLRGGAHILLEADIASVISERLQNYTSEVRGLLRSKGVGYSGLGVSGQSIVFSLTDKDLEDEVDEELSSLVRQEGYELSSSGGKFSIMMSDNFRQEQVRSMMLQSMEIIRARIDETGTNEPTIQRQGSDRILVQLPGANPERIKRLLGQTAKLTFHLLSPAHRGEDLRGQKLPLGTIMLPAYNVSELGSFENYYLLNRRVEVSGERLTNAAATFDATQGGYIVSLSFDSLGARQFGRVTSDNINRRLAIVLDGKVISAPNIETGIIGGDAIIRGGFSANEANDLALLLRAGALPVPLNILEERSVGPSLGADSIRNGKYASLAAFILVVLFMPFAYGLFGLFASVSLAVNLLMILGILSVLQASLTLPGIAGIVLTIGMAVDANVLIFERIREELRTGRLPANAIENGYKQALGTIIDANLTTLITALILYLFGSGPIRGFAVTLSIGLLTSMFTAIEFTRLLVVMWLRKNRRKVLEL